MIFPFHPSNNGLCYIADKLLINILSVSLWVNGTLPTPVVGLWLLKDVVLMTATVIHVKSNTAKGLAVADPVTTPLKVQPTNISKINTALQFVTLAVGIVHPVAAAAAESALLVVVLPEYVLPALCWLTGATTLASLGSYLGHSAFAKVSTPKPRS